jgi:peroxiredoxin
MSETSNTIPTSLSSGAIAPDFTLKAHDGQNITLSSFRGSKNVLLIFYPLDFSPVCSIQLPEFSVNKTDFEALDTVVFGINRDSVYTHKAWAQEYMIEVPLLADLKSEVARRYGVHQEEKGYSTRASFLIDKTGVVQLAHVEENGNKFTLRADDVLGFLRQA